MTEKNPDQADVMKLRANQIALSTYSDEAKLIELGKMILSILALKISNDKIASIKIDESEYSYEDTLSLILNLILCFLHLMQKN